MITIRTRRHTITIGQDSSPVRCPVAGCRHRWPLLRYTHPRGGWSYWRCWWHRKVGPGDNAPRRGFIQPAARSAAWITQRNRWSRDGR